MLNGTNSSMSSVHERDISLRVTAAVADAPSARG
jgi:hypothetical protein